MPLRLDLTKGRCLRRDSYEQHLRSAGIVVKREVSMDEAAQVLRQYGEIGVINNK